MGHRVAPLPGRPPTGRYAWHRCLARLTTGTSGCGDANGGDAPGATVASRTVSHLSRDHALALPLLATLLTGIMLGVDRWGRTMIVLAADERAVSPGGSSRGVTRYHP